MPAVGDSPTSIRDARAFARSVCADDGVSADLCQALEVVMSELVGNAVRHGRHPVSFEVEHLDGASLLIPVAATEPQPAMQNRTKLSIEALHDLTLAVEQLDADRSE